VKTTLWFLLRFLALSLLLALFYWNASPTVNAVFARSSQAVFAWFELPFSVEVPRDNANQLDVTIPAPGGRAMRARLDGRPFHFNLVPLLGLFLATPGLSLRKKLWHCVIALAIAWPTYTLHLFLNLVELGRHEVIIRQYSFWAWADSVGRWFLLQTMRHGSIFMKQTGSLFIPFLLWGIFYFRWMRFIFYPEERVRREIEQARATASAAGPAQPDQA
jgi:hypothetical protein